MKKFLIGCFGYLFLLLSCAFTTPESSAQVDPGQKFQILFNSNTGFVELALIQAECDKQGIRLTYKKIEFDDAGRLQSLSFKVDCADGFSGAASTDHLNKNQRFGFYRDYTKNTKTPFAVGAIASE